MTTPTTTPATITANDIATGTGTTHPLPHPFSTSSQPLVLISQGAEALLYHTTFLRPTLPIALKYRPPKPYRHPTLDRRLTRQRILAETRVLTKCAREGIAAPHVLGVGAEEGWLAMTWVEGEMVKAFLRRSVVGRRKVEQEQGQGQGQGQKQWKGQGEREREVKRVLGMVGRAVGGLHSVGVVHGDLTSSNMLMESKVRGEGETEEGRIVLIDFGLAQMGTADEERAVDLYVLERAFASTHPELEEMFADEVLRAYGESYKGAKVALKRLEDVRMRGRKKSMIG